MTNAKRRINSTGRKRIRHQNIDIRMVDTGPNQPLHAKASIDLSDHEFPSAALISIEAYHRSTGMRFDCGTVGNPAIPDILVLNEVDQSGSVLFRVKIVEHQEERGRILGSAERIQPTSENEEKDRHSLFPVLYRSLGEQVWKVEINAGDRPKLILNREIPGIKLRLKTDAFLQGILFPAAFRLVLEALAAGANDGDEDDDSERPAWQEEWLRFCREGLNIIDTPPANDPDDKQKWVDYAVERFCAEYGFMKAIRKQEEEAHESATT